MSRLHAILLTLLAGWTGCASVSEVRKADPGFTAEALRDGGLVIVGVVQVNEVPQVRPLLVDALERVLTATRRDIPLVPAARVGAALDDSTERILLLGYQMHGEPAPAWLDRAASSLMALGRYGVLARVESDKVRFSVRHAPPHDPTLQSPTGRILVTGRDAKVAVHVYDLTTRSRMFDATYIGAAETVAVDSLGLAGAAPPPQGASSIDVARKENPNEVGYPAPPPLARALEPAFLELARSLPGGPPEP